MKITLLGQAGFLIELINGKTIMIDPYLSNSLQEQKGNQFERLIPIKSEFRQRRPDILIFTHNHGDHYDMESVATILDGPPIIILGPFPVFKSVTSRWSNKHNVIVMNSSVEYSQSNLHIKAVIAFHETNDCVGYVLESEGKSIYFSGDTLYSEMIIQSLKGISLDAAFVCINGCGNNMNAIDAGRLVDLLKPKLAVPVHWDMFERFGADPKTFHPQVTHKILRAYESLEI